MTTFWKAVSALALAATIVPPLLYVRGGLDLDAMKLWMTLAAVAWFVATPMWMKAD
jgi:hypothetical protein